MKKITKILAIILSLVFVFGCFAACGKSDDNAPANQQEGSIQVDKKDLKVGFIFLHDENSTYDKNFIDAAVAACEELGVEYVMKKNIPETAKCQEAAEDLVDQGCNIIFADSFNHEGFLIEVAKENPDVQFCHATGTRAHTEGLANYSNAFASIYEGRYLAGVAAGMKLNEMIAAGKFTAEEAKIGYVGAYTYAEVISGYTSFYLGAKSVCPTVTMDVQFTGEWYDEALEKEAATALINSGCKLISQHADSMGAPTACESAGIPNVSYNGSTQAACPNTFIVSSRIDWTPYFKHIINCVIEGKDIEDDWTGTLETGSVVLTDVNTAVAAAGTVEKLEEVKAQLIAGEIHVFDITTFTVKGAALTDAHLADVDTDDKYTPDTKVVADNYFHESEFRSAPYFDIQIDGINLLNSKF